MHPTARTCIGWAVALVVLGAVVVTIAPRLLVSASAAGSPGAAGVAVLDVVLTLVRGAVFPLGAALVGAAVVIQTLTTEQPSVRNRQHDRGGVRND